MLGFNGGLIGKDNTPVAGPSIPGVWTSREQEVAVRRQEWAGAELLDLYPGATAAYSLRTIKLSETSSPVVNVRRSSGSPSTEDFTATQVADGTLAAWVGAGDGFVTTWYDQSGNSNHAIQINDGSQPLIVSSGTLQTEPAVNGKPAIIFGTGGEKRLLPPIISLGENCAFFAVTKHTNPTGNWSWFVGEQTTNSGFFLGKRSGNVGAHLSFAGYFAADVPNTNIAQYAVSYWQQGTGISQYRINATSGALLDGFRTSNFLIGGRAIVANEGWFGPIQEIIYYPTSQVSTFSAMVTSINSYYNVYT